MRWDNFKNCNMFDSNMTVLFEFIIFEETKETYEEDFALFRPDHFDPYIFLM